MAEESPRREFLEMMARYSVSSSPSIVPAESGDSTWGWGGGFLDAFEQRVTRIVGSYGSGYSSVDAMSLGSSQGSVGRDEGGSEGGNATIVLSDTDLGGMVDVDEVFVPGGDYFCFYTLGGGRTLFVDCRFGPF